MTTELSRSISKYHVLLCAVAVWLALGSCHTLKKTTKGTGSTASAPGANSLSPDVILSRLKENTIDYKTFSAKARLSYSTPKESQKGITTYIRMQKDSAIWISVRPVLGIELIRVLITPDSIKMINFFKNTLTVAGTDSLQQVLHIPYDFSMLQNLILGNPVLLSQPEDILQHGDTTAMTCRKGKITSSYKLLSEQLVMQSNQLTIDQDTSQPLYSNQIFEDYSKIGNRLFSTRRLLDVRAPQATHVELVFSRADFDEPLSLPFPQPSGFRTN